jgi:hypothetical protein
VSYPGTRESVNFRGAPKLCQFWRKSTLPYFRVRPKNTKNPRRSPIKRAAPAQQIAKPSLAAAGKTVPQLTVLTIGHSTRTFEEFLSMLQAHGVEQLVDIRSIPKSRRVPQFNSDALASSLHGQGIKYVHLKSLGGRRHAKKDSLNLGWRNASFRGYADYMATQEFHQGLSRLLGLAQTKRTAIMCAEAVPWRCHRSLVGDALLVRGVRVQDILSATSQRPHQLTPFAKVTGFNIVYPEESAQAKPPLS